MVWANSSTFLKMTATLSIMPFSHIRFLLRCDRWKLVGILRVQKTFDVSHTVNRSIYTAIDITKSITKSVSKYLNYFAFAHEQFQTVKALSNEA